MTMIGRLRLLRRFSDLQISPSGAVLPFTALRNLYSVTSPARRQQRGQKPKFVLSLQLQRRREEDGFCTRAMETEEAQLFSPYLWARIRCSKDVADTLSEALLCFGASSASIDEINSQDSCETWITSLFVDGQDVHACISLAADSICLQNVPNYEVSKGEQCDWLKNIEETFHPIEVTSGLWIVPKWKTPPKSTGELLIMPSSSSSSIVGLNQEPIISTSDNYVLIDALYFGTSGSYLELDAAIGCTLDCLEESYEIPTFKMIIVAFRDNQVQNATNIVLSPGMAFGTGEHPTTKLCLCLLHSLIKGGEMFLDYGTGSGVLGIAALKMGAEFSVGIDVDSQAVASALQNIALNEIETDKMRVYLVSGVESSNSKELSAAKLNFDIVIANILLNPLLELADDIVSYGKPGAVIGLSGIISEQIHQIKERFSLYLDDISVAEMDGWACIHGIKRAKQSNTKR